MPVAEIPAADTPEQMKEHVTRHVSPMVLRAAFDPRIAEGLADKLDPEMLLPMRHYAVKPLETRFFPLMWFYIPSFRTLRDAFARRSGSWAVAGFDVPAPPGVVDEVQRVATTIAPDSHKLQVPGLWLSGGAAQSSWMHWDSRDPYNLNFQLTGRKTFTLFDPTDEHVLSMHLEKTRFIAAADARVLHGSVSCTDEEKRQLDAATVQPVLREALEELKKATAYRVTLEPGDCLYVPIRWWHFVEHHEAELNSNLSYWFTDTARELPPKPRFSIGRVLVPQEVRLFFAALLGLSICEVIIRFHRTSFSRRLRALMKMPARGAAVVIAAAASWLPSQLRPLLLRSSKHA